MLFVTMVRVTMCTQGAKVLALFLTASVLSGCAGLSEIRQTESFYSHYSAGNFDVASAVIGGSAGLDYPEKQLLSSLHVAMALRAAGRFQASQIAFDRAEAQLLWKSNSIASVEDLLSAGLTLVSNDLMVPYRGTIYEGVLVNTFKSTNAMMLADTSRARVELNRASQRQANAVNQLAAKVRALRVTDGEEEQHRESIERSIDQAIDPYGPVARRLQVVESLGEYRGLRNPFTDWLHGVLRLATGEANRASDLFRNAAAIDGQHNSYVLADLVVAEQVANGLGVNERVWVVHEDGTGPSLRQFRFDLPVFADDERAIIVSMALPDLRPGSSVYPVLQVRAGGEYYRTETLLDIDRYAATEFLAVYDAVLLKAVAGTVIRTLLQLEIQENTKNAGGFGSLFSIVTPLASAVVTQADTRIWRALPRTIGVASLPRPADDKLHIVAGDRDVEVVLPRAPFVLVTVKTIRNDVPPNFHVAVVGG